MKTRHIHRWLLAGAACAFSLSTQGQIIEFRATINAAQETTASTSTATGSAILLYDVGSNTFDLWVTLEGMANTLSASHIHEGAAGVAGSVVTSLGAEAVYTRDGTTVTGVFRGVTHGGSALTLLQSGAYLNFHSATYPAGEIRGQLIAQPKRLTAIIDNVQEAAAFPSNTYDTDAYGAAVMTYNPATNKVDLRISLYAYKNTLTNSHFHAGAPGVSGPVTTGLGGETASNYVRDGEWITGTFSDLDYTGDVLTLLTGGTYLNFHSNVYAGGEIRGQVLPSDESLGSRLANSSVRGMSGSGDQVLIGGVIINGPEPVRVLLTAKGPSLANYGVTGVLENPYLSVHDVTGRQIARNDDVGTIASGSELSLFPNPPSGMESGVILVLPPGAYTSIASGVGGTTGVALVEAYDGRDQGSNGTMLIAQAARERAPTALTNGQLKAAVELCGAPATAATKP